VTSKLDVFIASRNIKKLKKKYIFYSLGVFEYLGRFEGARTMPHSRKHPTPGCPVVRKFDDSSSSDEDNKTRKKKQPRKHPTPGCPVVRKFDDSTASSEDSGDAE